MNSRSGMAIRTILSWGLTTALGMLLWNEPAATAAPANDNFANATELVALYPGLVETIEFTGSLAGATVEPGENQNADLAAANERGTIWWKWKCVGHGSVEFTAASEGASVVAAAFIGTSVSE